jgi:hypothetical protein
MAGQWRNVLDGRRTECKEEEGLRIDVAMDRALVLRSIEARVRARVRDLASGIREEEAVSDTRIDISRTCQCTTKRKKRDG